MKRDAFNKIPGPFLNSLLKHYAQMPGDKKVRLGLALSETVRKVRQDGINAVKQLHEKRSRTTT